MAQDKYRSIRLPEELIQEIEKVIESGESGYKSKAEFIKEAVRNQLYSIEERKKKKGE